MNSKQAYSVLQTLILILLSALIIPNNALHDGDMLRLTSLFDGNVFTVTGKAGLSGVNVTAEPWQDGTNEKWLVVEAVAGSDRFLLLPKYQSWDWQNFAKVTTKGRRDHLPDYTVVLTTNVDSNILSQEGVTSKSTQQWKTVDALKGSVLIKNVQTEQCVYNPGEQTKHESGVNKAVKKVTHLFSKHQEKKRVAGVLHTASCDSSQVKQLWRPELLY